MTDDRSRCKQCFIQKRTLGWRIFKKYKVLLGFIAFIWFYTVFPIPLFADIDPLFYWITLFAAILIMIPVGLMVFFWNKNPPGAQGR